MTRLALLLLCLSVACSESSKSSKTSKTETSVADCDERAHSIADRLQRFTTPAPILRVPADSVPVSSLGNLVDEDGPVVAIDAQGVVTFRGAPLKEDGPTLLRAMAAVAPAAKEPATIFLQADGDAKVAAVRAVLDMLGSQAPVHLLLRTPASAESPLDEAPAPIQQQIASMRNAAPAERATLAARAIEDAIGSCSSLEVLFSSLAHTGPASKEEQLQTGIAPALLDCRCKVADIDLLEYMLLGILHEGQPLRSLPIAASGPGDVVEVTADTSVAQLLQLAEAESVSRGIVLRSPDTQ